MSRDSSDDFFNSWDSSPGRQQRAPPPPPRRTAAAPPPPLRPNTSGRTLQPPLQQPRPPPAAPAAPPQHAQPPARSYLLNNNNATPPSPPHQPSAASYYSYGGGGGTTALPAAPTVPGGGRSAAAAFAAPPAAPKPTAAAMTNPYATPPVPSPYSTPPAVQQPQQPAAYSGSGFLPSQQPITQQQQQPYGFSMASTPNYDIAPAFLQGTMDNNGIGGIMGPSTLLHDAGPSTFTMPNNPYASKQLAEDEPPLLEELGINVEHIIMKTKAVVIPFRRFHKENHSALTDPALIMEDADLAGPLALALLLGGELMMTGKLQFGYIYGFGVFGCLAMTVILNLMSPDKAISFWTVASVLGYALLPVNILAALKIVFWGYFTEVLGVLTVIWSTTASTRLLEVGCGMVAQRYLLAYPIALLYSAFVLITIF